MLSDNNKSAILDDKIWHDLTDNKRDFTWNTTPQLFNNKFTNIHNNGLFAEGPKINEIGIDNSYSLIYAAKTKSNNNNQIINLDGNILQGSRIKVGDNDIDINKYSDKYNVVSINKYEDLDEIENRIKNNDTRYNTTYANNTIIYINGNRLNDPSNKLFRRVTKKNNKLILGSSDGKINNCKADIGALIIYDRPLTEQENKLLGEWLKTPYFGSNISRIGRVSKSKNNKK